MPKIPTYRRQRLPSTNVGAAPLPMSAANVAGEAIGQGLSALGGGISDVGQSLLKIKEADNKNKDLLAESRMRTATQEEELSYKEKISQDGDVNNYPQYRKESIDKVNALRETLEWGNNTTKQRADLFASGWESTFTRQSEIGIIKKRSDEAIKVTELNLVQSLSSLDASPRQEILTQRAEEAYRESLSFKYGKEMVDALTENAIANGTEIFKKNSVVGLRPEIEQVLIENEYDLKSSIPAIDKFVGQLQKNGTLNSVEAAEARQDLTNWAADTAAQRKRVQNENIIQTSMGFADELAKGTFTGDDVALSNLTKKEKEAWQPIVEGARKDPPTESTLDGSNISIQTITDYATGKIGELEAINSIITERYENQSITDDYYNFAINRIKNKYPNDVAKVISGATEAAKSVVHQSGTGFFGKDWIDSNEKAKLVEVNTGLLSWIEAESKDGKYPSGEEIYIKVRELGISVKVPVATKTEIPLVIPKQTEPTYITNDGAYDELASGTKFWDATTGVWRVKP